MRDVHQTPSRIVNDAVGRLNLGTLVVAPRDTSWLSMDLDDAVRLKEVWMFDTLEMSLTV